MASLSSSLKNSLHLIIFINKIFKKPNNKRLNNKEKLFFSLLNKIQDFFCKKLLKNIPNTEIEYFSSSNSFRTKD